jgi:hypothetical protein
MSRFPNNNEQLRGTPNAQQVCSRLRKYGSGDGRAGGHQLARRAQRFGTNDHYRKELAILAQRFLESAKEMEECWAIASMCAALTA